MTTEHLPELDALASKASGKPTMVVLDDLLIHVRGMADYDGHHYVVRLNPALLRWLRAELESTFYHEISHVKLGHVSTALSVAQRTIGYNHVVNHKPQTLNDAYPTVGAQLREEAADDEAARLRRQWPFASYSLWKLITGKEIFP